MSLSFDKGIIKSYAFQRVITAGLVFITSLVSAAALGPKIYGQLAIITFMGKTLLLVNFGSSSGFIYNFYDKNTERINEESFVLIYFLHLFVFFLLILYLCLFISKVYVFGAVCFGLLIPFFVVEPSYRIKRIFFVSLLPDLIISISIIITLFFVTFNVFGDGSAYSLFSLFLVIIPFSYIFLNRLYKLIFTSKRFLLGKADFVKYSVVLKKGFFLYLGTAAFLIFISLDRIFLERFHSDISLSTYMLSFQLATGSCLILTAINFTAVVDYGELARTSESFNSEVDNKIIKSIKLSIVSLLGTYIAVRLLEKYYFYSYVGLSKYTMIIVVGLLLFYIAGSITPVAFYLNKQKQLTLFFFILIFLSLLHNYMVIKYAMPSILLAVFTSLWLSLYSIFSIFYVKRLLREEI